jgi:hypothetical protein
MALGGLAIAIGLLVDRAVVVVENVEHRLAHAHDATLADRVFMTLEATSEVAMPLTSGVIIIVTVFLPLLSLEGLEGRLFAPVALTIAFALASPLIQSLTVERDKSGSLSVLRGDGAEDVGGGGAVIPWRRGPSPSARAGSSSHRSSSGSSLFWRLATRSYRRIVTTAGRSLATALKAGGASRFSAQATPSPGIRLLFGHGDPFKQRANPGGQFIKPERLAQNLHI